MEIKNPPIKKNNGKQVYAIDLMPKNADAQRILKKRAELIAKQTVKIKEAENLIGFVRFRLANEYYGIPYQFVNEVIQKSNITKIPLVPKFVEGVMNWRGMLLAIINLKSFFNIKKTNDDLINTSVVVIEHHKIVLGILVDDISGNDIFNFQSLDPPLVSVNTINAKYILGLHKGAIAIVNVENICAEIKLPLEKLVVNK